MSTAVAQPGQIFHPIFGGRWSPEPRRPDGSRWPSMGFAAAAWIQAKTGLQLDPWQVELLRRAMLYDPDTLGPMVDWPQIETCDWIVRDVLVVGPEGIGKSAFFAGIGEWFLDGPCLPPEDAPQPYPDPDIPVVSAALTLTEHIHRYAKKQIESGSLAGRLEVENTRIFRRDRPEHRIAFPAGSGAYQQGKNPKPIILEEELHVLNSPGVKANGEETIDVVSSKRSKTPHPKVQRYTITNPDDGDPESLLGKRWQHAEKVLSGEVDDAEMLVVHYHAAEPWDLDDPVDLRRGIREATPSSWSDVEAIAAKYEKDHQSPGRFKRFSGGLFHAGDDQVLPDGTLEALAVPPDLRELPPADVPVALVFDSARNRDSIAFGGCTADGYGFTIRLWERPDDVDPREFRYRDAFKDDVDETIRWAMNERFPHALLGVDADPQGTPSIWESEADEWETLWPGRVVRDIKSMGAAAWEQFRKAVLDGDYAHDGHPALYRHMRNAREKVTRTGKALLEKKRKDGRHPIDLFVVATYALRLASTLPDDSESLEDWRQALGLGQET